LLRRAADNLLDAWKIGWQCLPTRMALHGNHARLCDHLRGTIGHDGRL
jgi:hypothetical protein